MMHSESVTPKKPERRSKEKFPSHFQLFEINLSASKCRKTIQRIVKKQRGQSTYCLGTLPGIMPEIVRDFWLCSRLSSVNFIILELDSALSRF
jgi:hypothetical protein